MFIPKEKPAAIKGTSIVVSLVPLAMSIWLWFAYTSRGRAVPERRAVRRRRAVDSVAGRELHDGRGRPQRAADLPDDAAHHPEPDLLDIHRDAAQGILLDVPAA